MDGVKLTSLQQIETLGGAVWHAMKSGEPGFTGFGEAYFSIVDRHAIKGWKRHREMTLNLVVPCGSVLFVVCNDGDKPGHGQSFEEYLLGPKDRYARLTVEPGLWVAFRGQEDKNVVLNIADILHSPDEVDTREIEKLPYSW